jgi:hypothetical protein
MPRNIPEEQRHLCTVDGEERVSHNITTANISFENVAKFQNGEWLQQIKVACFIRGNSPASEFYMPTFRNTIFLFHRQVGVMPFFTPICIWRWNRQSVPKRRHIKFRRRGITQKKTYNIQNMAKVLIQEIIVAFAEVLALCCSHQNDCWLSSRWQCFVFLCPVFKTWG